MERCPHWDSGWRPSENAVRFPHQASNKNGVGELFPWEMNSANVLNFGSKRLAKTALVFAASRVSDAWAVFGRHPIDQGRQSYGRTAPVAARYRAGASRSAGTTAAQRQEATGADQHDADDRHHIRRFVPP